MADGSELSRETVVRSIFHQPLVSSIASRPILVVAVIAGTVSLLSFLYFFSNGMTNVYGDGAAHVNIARKVVDSPDSSLRQRYIQIGSPWLPLQTVSMLPLVANDWMWRTGAAGSIISMISLVVAAIFLYLLARGFYKSEDGIAKKALPVVSVGILLFNPSVLYLQSTPMSELLFMAALAAAVYTLQRWMDNQTLKRLVLAALIVTLATLARYEAWAVAALSLPIVTLTTIGDWSTKLKSGAIYSVLIAIGPIYWLWHNWLIYGNALEFLTGPNSARGLYLQNRANLGWSAIFAGHPLLDTLTIATAVAVCAGPFVLLLGMTGFVTWLLKKKRTMILQWPLLLLMVPFLFHVFSLYRGEIQIFPLSAFGLLNVRYGLPHLLAVALFAPAIVSVCKGKSIRWVITGICLIVALQYGYLISDGVRQLAVFQEGYRNGVNSKAARERAQVASFLRENPPAQMTLMHTGALGPVVPQGGMRFSKIIHEGTARWYQLDDGIPEDISDVILQQGDPLDLRLRASATLSSELASRFQVQLSVGNIRVLVRKN
jgi:hypothetical protein